ncbi:S8 family serine peptidase [Methylomonas sp. HYX-M1]|uniref:S8 family peptidase n=1 Tax=Methylomonas sp. HYX-M1 TaxID=3139307 RepID=UPI00345C5334
MNTLRILTIAWRIGLIASLSACSFRLPVALQTPKQLSQHQILVTLPERDQRYWPQIAKAIAEDYQLEMAGEFPLASIGLDCLVFKVPNYWSMPALLKSLQEDERVVLAQQNQVFDSQQSDFAQAFTDLSYAPALMHADRAHKLATGKGVKIAVIDTGADYRHPELSTTIAEKLNFVDGGDKSFGRDKHGTAVSGVIGASAGNGIGIDGIAPDAEIIVLKSCWYDESGSAGAKCSSWSLAKALDAAIAQGVQIANLSLAGPYDPLLEKLLQEANRRSINLVAATLEKSPQPGFPAQLDFVVPVISAKRDGTVSRPGWLPQVPAAVAAPGVEIVTTAPGSGYDVVSGSSLAAAHVTGVIALLLERDRALLPATIQRILAAASHQAGQPQSIDACRVLEALDANGGG